MAELNPSSYREDDGSPIQGIFDFDTGSTDGYQNWLAQQEERLEAVRREWGLPIGYRVRLKHRQFDGEFIGVLRLLEQPVSIDKRAPLRLRLNQIEFGVPDIERCLVEG